MTIDVDTYVYMQAVAITPDSRLVALSHNAG
jgi:hypothetical protein